MSLKYLYKATFIDGTTYEQPEDDSSVLMPGVKSSFYDFERMCEVKQLKSFEIYENKFARRRVSYLVDLIDGHFEINGTRIIATPSQNLTKAPQKYKLIYFRERQKDATATVTMEERDGKLVPIFSNDLINGEERLCFFIGWQCIVEEKNDKEEIIEKNYQQLIGIK